MYYLTISRVLWANMQKNMQKYTEFSKLFFATRLKKTLSNSINGNDVHKALKLNCEMYGPFNLRLEVLKIFPNQSFKF